MLGLDNLNDAYDPRLKTWRLAQLEHQPGFVFQRLDIGDRPALRSLLTASQRQPGPAGGFAAIINLAARAGGRASVVDPWAYLETNVTGALKLLEARREFDLPQLLSAPSPRPFGQSTDPVSFQPLTPPHKEHG